MQFKRLSILGVGLLGGSIGLAVKRIASRCEIVGYGHRPATLEAALRLGAIDRPAKSPSEAVEGSDLVILCTPVGIFQPLLQEIAGHLTPGAIVTDVGSTKRSVVQLAEQTLPAAVHFVGSHPMAGSEKRGVEFARADLFTGALCIVTPTPRTDPGALAKVENFWTELGMRIKLLSPEDHDRLVCDISHLPHALAATLVAMQSDEALPLAGKGFLDSTRIAAGDAGLWRDILLDNADSVRSSLARLRAQLDELEKRLDPKQAQALFDWLQKASEKRSRLNPSS
jgi:prephenate dehydrogenase